MKHLRHLIVLGVFALTACGGGGTSTAPAAPAGTTGTSTNTQQALVSTSFAVSPPQTASASAKARVPQYVGAGAQSVSITLNTVNGGAPPAGLTLTVTSAITPASCPCTVSGPLVPPGSDNFSFMTSDSTGGNGSVIATSTGTYTITAGVANTGNSVTLQGLGRTLTITGVPSGTAGTAFGSPATLTLVVQDADGNTITGAYAQPVTVQDLDVTGAQGTQLTVNSGTPGSTVTISQSSDVLKMNYGGLAIPPAALDASANGASLGAVDFTPTLSPIVYAGPLNGSTPEIDLYAQSGTGSTGTFTASEVGLTNSPYNKSLNAATAGCGSVGTISPASGTSFTFTVAGSPSAGSCSIHITDGLLGQSKTVTGTYTTSGFGVN
jgi:hypothetical protein